MTLRLIQVFLMAILFYQMSRVSSQETTEDLAKMKSDDSQTPPHQSKLSQDLANPEENKILPANALPPIDEKGEEKANKDTLTQPPETEQNTSQNTQTPPETEKDTSQNTQTPPETEKDTPQNTQTPPVTEKDTPQQTQDATEQEEEEQILKEIWDEFSKELRDLMSKPIFKESLEDKNPFKHHQGEEKHVSNLQDLTSYKTQDIIPLQENVRVSMLYENASIELNDGIFEYKLLVLELSEEARYSLNIYQDETLYQNFGIIDFKENLLVIPTINLKPFSQKQLKLVIGHLQTSGIPTIISYSRQQFLTAEFNKSLKIHTQFLSQIEIELSTKELTEKQRKNPNNRIQFIVKQHIQSELYGSEYLNFFVNQKKPDFPQTTLFDFRASGQTVNGLIKTLNAKNKYYCLKRDDCTYRIRIYLDGLQGISFYASLFPNEQILAFKQTLKAVEELENGEVVKYTLNVPNVGEGWIFEVDSTQGKVKSHLHLDKKPEELSQYTYQTEGVGVEKIVLNPKEIMDSNSSGKLYQIAFKCLEEQKPCVFDFKFYSKMLTRNIELEEKVKISGKLEREEVVNFELNLFTGHNEIYDISLNFQDTPVDIEAMIIECGELQFGCQLQLGDFRNETQKKTSDLIIKREEKNKFRLQVNCLGQNPFKDPKDFKNGFFISNKCKLVVGIRQSERDSVNYSLMTTGNVVEHDLTLGQNHHVKMFANQVKRFRVEVEVKSLSEEMFIGLKLTLMEGYISAYLDVNNQNLTNKKYDSNISINSKNSQSLSIKEKTVFVQVPEGTQNCVLYILMEAAQFSVLDMHVFLSEDQNEEVTLSEKIVANQQLLRKITKRDFLELTSEKLYFKNFYFEPSQEDADNDYFELSLNSKTIDLEMCVQVDRKTHDESQKCDFEAQGTELLIKKQDKFNSSYSIQVRKRVDKEKVQELSSIIFQLTVQFPQHKLHLFELLPRVQHSKFIDPKQEQHYLIDIRRMQHYGYILFTTHSVFVEATILGNLNDSNSIVQRLNRDTFGVKIHNVSALKKLICKKSCQLYLKIQSNDLVKSKFSVLYLEDDNLIIPREGEQLFVPSNYKLYFFYQLKTKEMLYMDFFNEQTESILYAKRHGSKEFPTNKESLFNESFSDFKSQLSNKGDIWMGRDSLQDEVTGVLFMIVPKINIINEIRNTIETFHQSNKTRITVHQKLQILNPYQETSERVFKGDQIYFQFQILEPRDFEIFLTIHSGSAQMYLERGVNKFPSYQKYLKKGDNYHDKEIRVETSEFQDPQQIMGTYHIAVSANQNSHVSVLLTDHFASVRRIKFQHLLTIPLKENVYYYLDYWNSEKVYDTYMYSNHSDIEVSLILYKRSEGETFLKSVEDENNILQKFTLHNGGDPRRKSQLSGDPQNHYVIRLLSKKQTEVDFAIYDPEKPMIIPTMKQILFGMSKDQSQLFSVQLHSEFQEVDVDIRLEYGEISYSVSDSPFKFQNKRVVKGKGVSTFKYADEKRLEEQNDIIIFKDIFIKIKSKEESMLHVRVTPKNSFKMMKPFVAEIVQLQQQSEQFYYFTINQLQVSQVKTLTINIQHIQYFDPEPELYFMSDNNISLDSNSPFLPLPIKDRIEKVINEVKQIKVLPEIQHGIFIIKFPKSINPRLIKMVFTINDDYILEPNGSYQNVLPINETAHRFKIYIPEAGELRILLDKCFKLEMEQLFFMDMKGNKEMIQIEGNFAQAYPYVYLDQASNKLYKLEKQIVPIHRVVLKTQGIVGFQLNTTEVNSDYFQITTEFLPTTRKLFLKDYLDFSDDHQKDFNFQFLNGGIIFKIRVPRFKKQIVSDYDFKLLKVELFIDLVHSTDFQKQFDSCGYKILDQYVGKKSGHSIIKRISLEDLEKEDYFAPQFESSEFQQFKDLSFFSVISMLRITMLNNEEEEHEITLNQNFTEVPYFLTRIKNPQAKGILTLKNKEGNYSFLIVLGIFCVLGFFYWLRQRRRQNEMRYEKPRSQLPGKLEMVQIKKIDYFKLGPRIVT